MFLPAIRDELLGRVNWVARLLPLLLTDDMPVVIDRLLLETDIYLIDATGGSLLAKNVLIYLNNGQYVPHPLA